MRRRRSASGATLLLVGSLVVLLAVPSATAAPRQVTSATGGNYVPLTAQRLADTRPGSGEPDAGDTLASHGILTITMPTIVPLGAAAVALNVTAVDATASGFLTVYPAGEATPLESVLNFEPGAPGCTTVDCVVPNLVISQLSSANQVVVYNGSTGTVNVVVDLEGYFNTAATTIGVAGRYVALPPARLADTRCGDIPVGAGADCAAEHIPAANAGLSAVAGGQTIAVAVAGDAGVPATGAEAAVVQLTATNTTANGYLTAYPGGTSRPLASNVNWVRGQTASTRAIVPLGPNGAINVYNYAGHTDVAVDVVGYFTSSASTATSAALFTPIPPGRITDTRLGSGQANAGDTLGSGSQLTVAVAGATAGGLVIPAEVDGNPTAAVLNVTEATDTASSYLTVTPSAVTPPAGTSDVNFSPGQTTANTDLATLSSSGTISVYNYAGNTNVAIDAFGYFTVPPSNAPPPVTGGGTAPTVEISLAPGTSPTELVGASATVQVTVLLDGATEPGAPVTVKITGPNAGTLTGTTGAAGLASLSYTGRAAGTDILTATSGSGTSGPVSITWSAPVAAAATSVVTGNFFPEPSTATSFVARPGDTPAFTQSFPDIAFNPAQGLLPIPPGAPDPTTVPFTDVVTDPGGAYAGTLPATGNGFQAGATTAAGDLTSFDAVFQGTLDVSQPGYLTIGVIAADGFIFGVGGTATATSGTKVGAPASGVTPFAGYPVAAADNACLPPSVGGSAAAPVDFPVTLHLPAAGTYPYEIDYFSCNTQSGGAPLRSLVLRAESISTTAPSAPTVYVGYADTTRLPNNEFHYFPFPWGGSEGVSFEGCSPVQNCQFDGGAVRIDNTTADPMTIDDLKLVFATTTGPYAPYDCTFDIWPNQAANDPVTLAPGATAIYAQEGSGASAGCGQGNLLDTSDVPAVSCTQSDIVPQVVLDVNGTTTTYTDTTRVLNTGGVDKATCSPSYENNESSPWTRVGGPGQGADVPLPPVASLTLSPIAALGGGPLSDEVGTSQPFTVSAVGSDGNPISGLPITLVVVGANPQRLQATTDSSGVASFSYTGTVAGNDTLAASADDQGLELASGQTTVGWKIPVPGGASSGGTPGQAPPAISATSPADGASITGATPVTASISPPVGDTITQWSVQLTPAGSGQGSTPVTLSSGTGSPPAPPAALATIDPTQLPDGTYQLSISATSSGGGVNTDTSEVVVAGTYKPGEYQAVYQDLSFPVPGFNVGVQRVYSSIDKSVGDFGVGWRLQLSDWTVGESGPLGAGGWTASATSCSLFGCQYQFNSSTAHTVTLTGPSGNQEVFDFTPSGGSGPLYFLAGNPGSFSAAPGTPTTGTLTVYDDPGLYYGFDGNLYNAALAGSGIYNPTEFVYTESNGTKLLMSTTAGLLDELLPDGNCIDFSSSGIDSFTGVSLANIAGCAGGNPGRDLSFVRDGSGRITSITAPNGETYTYTYDAAGDLTTVTPPAPSTPDTYTYDANHDMATQSGPGTPLTSLTYDSSGRLVKVTDAAGNQTTITNNVGGHEVVVGDQNGQLSTVYTYDSEGNLISEARTVGSQTLTDSWTYDSLGNVTSHTDPAGHTTTATYDASGNLTSFTNANGDTTDLTYNSLGEVTSETSPSGQVVYQATYNSSGQMLTSDDVSGTTSYTYTPAGQVATVTNPDGGVTSYTYDSSGDNISVTSPGNQTTQMSYNSMGLVTSTTAPSGAVTSYTYDSDGRLLTVTDGDGHVTTTDTYNSDGELATQTDGLGNTYSYTYTPTGQPASVTRPDGTVVSYTYNADGQLTGVDVPDGSGPSYTYNAFGQLTGATNSDSTVALTYLPDGQTATQTTSFTGTPQPAVTLNYSYDAAGNRTSLTDPAGTTTYGYNSNSQLTSITDPTGGVFGFSYDTGGSLVGLTRPNGVDDLMAYDPSINLLSKTSTLGATTVGSSTYTYNESNLVATMTSQSGQSTYGYNADGELTSVTGPTVTSVPQNYTYDAAGNQTSSSTVSSETYNANDELTSSSAATYAYNQLGEQTSTTPTGGSSTTYAWNDMGELTSVNSPSGTTSYEYDALGRRIEVDAKGQATWYIDDGTSPVLAYNSAGAIVAAWTNGLGSGTPLEVAEGGKSYYYLTDGENSVTALTNSAGAVVDSYTYGPYGATTATGTVANPFAYTGQAYDSSDGLYYLNARYYDPTTGRFLSPDPVASPNPYPYAGGDPTNFVDPSGAEAMVESAYLTVLNDQMSIAQQIQQINACLAGQLLYIVLAMRGYAISPPSLGKLAAQYLLSQANDAAQSQITNARNHLLDAIGMGWTGTAWDYASPYLENPSQWASTAQSNAGRYATTAAGYLLGKAGLPSGLASFANNEYNAAQSLAAAAQLAATGNPQAAAAATSALCN